MDSSSLNSHTWLLVAFATFWLLVASFAFRPRNEPRKVSLGTLPPELQQMIARLVDPIGLISLSQTNCHFRSLLKVQDRQRIERLLALECIPKHGGSPTIFTSWYDKPVWYNYDREARWACTGCMRLRPYYRFQYKFLSEVIWRKPMPATPIPNHGFTSWEPTSLGIAAATQITPSADGGRSLQERYKVIVGDFFRCDPALLLPVYRFHQVASMDAFTIHDLRQLIRFNSGELRRRLQQDLTAMSGVFGSDRYFRKCIECQFKSNVFSDAAIASHNGLYGTKEFPIISIENHVISSLLDRYFPGILENLQQGRPRARFYNGYPKLWPLWMARCPRCAKWKELKVFRIGASGPGRELESWEPIIGRRTWDGVILTQDVFEKARCNECFMKQHGRIALAEYLGRWFQFLVDQQPDDVQTELIGAAYAAFINYRRLTSVAQTLQQHNDYMSWLVECKREIERDPDLLVKEALNWTL